jgi:hypothetical protein
LTRTRDGPASFSEDADSLVLQNRGSRTQLRCSAQRNGKRRWSTIEQPEMAPAEHAPDQQTRNSERTDVANSKERRGPPYPLQPLDRELARAAAILGW